MNVQTRVHIDGKISPFCQVEYSKFFRIMVTYSDIVPLRILRIIKLNNTPAIDFKLTSCGFFLRRYTLISYFRTFRPFFEFIVRIPK